MSTRLSNLAGSPGEASARGLLRAGQDALRARYLAGAVLAITLAAVWHVSGVPISVMARFLAFEALYVVFPGCLLYMLLSRDISVPGARMRMLAIGWPVGYALEMGVFALTAALHARGAFTFFPLMAAASIGPAVVYRKRRAPAGGSSDAVEPRGGSREAGGWGVEALLGVFAISIALMLLAVRSFAPVPLPEHVSSAFYFVDNVWDISMASEALHHWPIAESYIAGHPLRYYVGVFIHVAALKQVMGVPIATSIFRLVPAMSTVVAMLQFWCLGSMFGRSRWAGPITVALLLVVENMKLYPTHTKVFGVALFSEFTGSPTYGFGVIFLVGLLILFRARFSQSGETDPAEQTSRAAPTATAGSLLLLAVLVLGAGTVKTTAAATFVAGLGLFWLVRLIHQRRLDRILSCWVAVSLACLAAVYLLLLSGSNAPAATEIMPSPLDFMKYTVFKSLIASDPGVVAILAATTVIILWKVLPVAWALWWLRRGNAWSAYWGLALSVFVVGFVVYVIMGSPAGNESYFIWYGYISLFPLTTVTLMSAWDGIGRDVRSTVLRAAVLTSILGLVTAGITQRLTATGELTGTRRALWYGAILVLVGGLVLRWSSKALGRLPPWRGVRGARAAACSLFLLGVLGCSESIVLAVPDSWRTALDHQAVPRDGPGQPGITAALYGGLLWVRDHTNRCDILAVSPPLIRPTGAGAGSTDSGYFDYSAFAEREVFFESWVMTIQGQHGEQPYPARFALNAAATRDGDQGALRELARLGVSYVLLDKIHGADARGPGDLGRLVFSNSALDVYRLTVPAGAHHC
jgi:hypothetical protein